jgi:AraC-like DNA-binding protein
VSRRLTCHTQGMHAKHGYRSAQLGLETFPRGSAPPRHRHLEGYASVVLAGSFVEAGFGGRVKVEPGAVLLHGRFDCHANRSSCARAVQILRLPWMDDRVEGHFCVTDPDLLARLAERDPRESMAALTENLQVVKTPLQHWTGRLASALQNTPSLSLSRWAGEVGMRPEALSRGFHREFGVSPKQFRLEARARRAWLELLRSPRTLTTIAQDFGFGPRAFEPKRALLDGISAKRMAVPRTGLPADAIPFKLKTRRSASVYRAVVAASFGPPEKPRA